MKCVILCGGLGTRLAEETVSRPKPMVTVGGKPILWHIMNIYGHYGFSDFVLALGYKGEAIKEYFLNYHSLNSDLSIDLKSGHVNYERSANPPWNVQLIDTGPQTLTGGRLLRLRSRLESTGTFLLTYGDGVSNVNLEELLSFHRAHGKLATVTSVRPTARFGRISFDGNKVTQFKEKVQAEEGWINGGFFVFEPGIFDYLKNDNTVLEADPMEGLARDGQLMAFRHGDFWQCMDTMRDRELLEEAWASGRAPWKIWKE